MGGTNGEIVSLKDVARDAAAGAAGVASRVPEAVAELVAVVAATEEATGVFLEAAEQLDSLNEGLPEEISAKLNAITTAIYEASAFQDITGQRVSKVRGILAEIEAKAAEMTGATGPEPGPCAPPVGAVPEPDGVAGDHDLLGGPALPGSGVTQEDIDAFFD